MFTLMTTSQASNYSNSRLFLDQRDPRVVAGNTQHLNTLLASDIDYKAKG